MKLGWVGGWEGILPQGQHNTDKHVCRVVKDIHIDLTFKQTHGGFVAKGSGREDTRCLYGVKGTSQVEAKRRSLSHNEKKVEHCANSLNDMLPYTQREIKRICR